ncbi:MAG TPA: efflux RND transporter periplasmic adaptor subunit [Gemmatimonadales bacterium]|nr:efflux RND transporter periplasmic adaptor subunit [Gemmatimonadales bacterium]
MRTPRPIPTHALPTLLVAGGTLLLGACKKEVPQLAYQAVPVERRDVVVSVQASGAIQPDTTVEVKSKASGEVLQILAETGQLVQRGDLLVKIDPRIPRNAVALAQSDLTVARAQLANAKAQKERADALYKSQSITQQEHDQANLDYANAQANVVKAQVALENANIQLADANVRAPITGTIIEKSIERGTIITSATGNVSGGTVLLKMADLSLVQVQALVDETDIGKIRPGLSATVTVDAYPNRPFQGEVLKIEPQATVNQNVTQFPVRVRIDNRGGLLRPGMNTEVEIHVGERDSVLTVPVAALRTPRDVGSAAQVLGLDPAQVQKDLAAQPAPPAGAGADTTGRTSMGASTPGGAAPADSAAKAAGKPESAGAGAANTMTMPDGRTVKLPEGVTAEQVRAIFAKFRSGEQPSASERAIMMKMRQLNGGAGGGRGGRSGRGGAGGADPLFGGTYIVFVKHGGQPKPVEIRTGLTDMDYSEVVSGLQAGDSVLVLPSASLVQAQQDMKERINRVTGGGGVPGMRQQSSGGSGGSRSGTGGR